MSREINQQFQDFFESIGYGVTYEGWRTGERWHEIYDEDGILFQCDFGVPIEEFVADLAYFARDEDSPRTGPDYTFSCPDENMDRLRALHARILDVREKRRSTPAPRVGCRASLVYSKYASGSSHEAGETGIVREVSGDTCCLEMNGGEVIEVDRGMIAEVSS